MRFIHCIWSNLIGQSESTMVQDNKRPFYHIFSQDSDIIIIVHYPILHDITFVVHYYSWYIFNCFMHSWSSTMCFGDLDCVLLHRHISSGLYPLW